MDLKALFQISHGVYLTGAKDEAGRLIGSCIDSVMVVETEPQQVIISLNNASYTMENVTRTGELTLSVLPDNTPMETIERFGMNSSRDINKWESTPHFMYHNLPIYKEAIAYMYLNVHKTFKTNGHHVFVCDVIDGQSGQIAQPLLYNTYQERKNQLTAKGVWYCTVCGYVYDGDIPFEALPEDWLCPLCQQPKSVFIKKG